MKRSLIGMVCLWIAGCCVVKAQTIKGKVIDRASQPIEGVAVVMQTMDSLYLDAVVTDSLGRFCLSQPESDFRLLFQHLLYEPTTKEFDSADAGVIVLSEKSYAIDEVTVRASRPQVKVEGGVFTYDVTSFIAARAVTNAYEVVKELPGISESAGDQSLQLAGADALNIIVNGQLTTLSSEQLQQMLKQIPASRVRKVEVMYAAPAKYNVKGAVINLLLTEVASGSWQGETGVEYQQHYYAKGLAHGNILFSDKGWTVDLLLNGSRGAIHNEDRIWAIHTLQNRQTEVGQSDHGKKRELDGTLRLGLDYKTSNNDKWSAAYYLQGERSTNRNRAHTQFTPLDREEPTTFSHSFTELKDHSALHNLHLQYDGRQELSVGMDYTHYKNPGRQYFLDKSGDSTVSELINPTEQRVDRFTITTHHTVAFEPGWQLNYGLSGGFASSFNQIGYLYLAGNDHPAALLKDYSEITRQKEYTANLFAEVSKSFGEKLSASLALKGEYYKAEQELKGKYSTLWNEWTLFPTLSLNYTISPQHIVQLNVMSDKNYPPYWATSAQRSPISSYSYIVGNPQLKPFHSYSGQLIYILMQKYTVVFFNSYCPDYFMQVPYQSDTEMKTVFRFENIDYSLQNGLQLTVPFSVKEIWRGQLSLTGIRRQEKASHFHSMSFNRKTYVGQVQLTNSFQLSSHPKINLTVDGLYLTPGMIQGLFKMSRVWNLSAGLKWSSADDRFAMVLKASDIFRTGVPDLHINTGSQRSNMYLYNDDCCLSLSLIWKLGGYKAKQHDEIDASRFGR